MIPHSATELPTLSWRESMLAPRAGCCICGGPLADGGVRLPGDGAYKTGERVGACCWGGYIAFLDSVDGPQLTGHASPECPDCRQATLDPFGGCTDLACPSNDLFRPRRLEAVCATS